MRGKRPAEITGAEALRIVVDSDHGMQRRIFVALAEYLAIDVAFGADDRPAVLFGQYHRLFPEREDRHDTSPVRPSLLWGSMFRERCLQLSVFCVVPSDHAGYPGSYPHTPTQPQALQKSQPSLLISA